MAPRMAKFSAAPLQSSPAQEAAAYIVWDVSPSPGGEGNRLLGLETRSRQPSVLRLHTQRVCLSCPPPLLRGSQA